MSEGLVRRRWVVGDRVVGERVATYFDFVVVVVVVEDEDEVEVDCCLEAVRAEEPKKLVFRVIFWEKERQV